MPYIGKSPLHGNYSKLDSVSSSFDGSTTQFALTTNSIAVTPVTASAVIISINGVIQEPTTAYTVSGTNVTFTSAPASTDTFFGVVLGEQLAIGTPSDSTITSAKLSGNLVTPGTLDVNGQELILDADADTSITADTDDQIDFKLSGADDFRMTANNFNVLSGSTLTIDSGASITNSGTATGFGSNTPSSADGQALGSSSAEWSDLYLADGGVIYFGNDQDVTVTHDPDDGLFLKSTATSDDNPVLLPVQPGETDIAADDVLGKISFQAPDEGTGVDAILVAAAIQARSEQDFSASINKTSIDFMTGASEAATTKMTLSSAGKLEVGGELAIKAAAGVLETNANFVDQVIFGPAVDGRSWKGKWYVASLYSSLMLATVEDAGSDTQVNIWDLTAQTGGTISTTALGTVTISGAATPTSIDAAMGYIIAGSEDGVTIIDPHSGSWAERTNGWPQSLSSSTNPALTNNDVQAVCAGILPEPNVYDPRTLGPMPTFGCAYGTGADCASIIKTDHTVIDRSGTVSNNAGVAIVNGHLVYNNAAGGSSQSLAATFNKIQAIIADDWTQLYMNRDNSANVGFGIDNDLSTGLDDFYASGSNEGLTFGHLGAPDNGASFKTWQCAVNRTYNTGFMPRTTRACWLANSDTADRDPNGHTLTKNGTVTEAAVASGAELKGYSGWSSTNYLQVTSHASWDEIGTGGCYITTWFKAASNSAHEFFGGFQDGSGVVFGIRLDSGGTVTARDDGATAQVDTTSSLVCDDSVWHKMDFVRISSTERYLYVDGMLEASNTTDAGSITNDGNLNFQVGTIGSEPATNCTLALFKFGITPPDADMIRTAFEAEKGMFAANAECLLQSGTTDAVLGSAVDPLTGKVLVTQTDAITIFDGCVVDSKPTVNSGNSEKGRLFGDLRTEQNSANAYVSVPAHDQAQINEMVRGISSQQLPPGIDLSKAKAWVVNGSNTSTPLVDTSFNVKSITRTATGKYDVAFAIPFKYDDVGASLGGDSQVGYCCVAIGNNYQVAFNYVNGVTSTRHKAALWTGDTEAYYDTKFMAVFFGELENE